MHSVKILIIGLFFLIASQCHAQDKANKPNAQVKQEMKSKEVRCSCPQKRSIAEELSSANVVFVGQVIELRPRFPLHEGYTYVRFLPQKKYKGFDTYPNKDSIVVFNPEPTDPCFMKFIKGNDYLVFANGNPGYLKTSNCGHTGLQEDRTKEITELDKLK